MIDALSNFASWIVNQITNILTAVWYGFTALLSLIFSTFMDLIIAFINVLPTSHFDAPAVPSGDMWVMLIRSANYFIDVPGMIAILGAAIALHLAIVVVIAALRFVQVMN